MCSLTCLINYMTFIYYLNNITLFLNLYNWFIYLINLYWVIFVKLFIFFKLNILKKLSVFHKPIVYTYIFQSDNYFIKNTIKLITGLRYFRSFIFYQKCVLNFYLIFNMFWCFIFSLFSFFLSKIKTLVNKSLKRGNYDINISL